MNSVYISRGALCMASQLTDVGTACDILPFTQADRAKTVATDTSTAMIHQPRLCMGLFDNPHTR